MNEFWVFGYGSLMWNPGFQHEEQVAARAHGFRRSLCVYSWVHRGTEQDPGLVLGLDHGGSCHGVAFRIHPTQWEETVSYLRARELVTLVYLEKQLRLSLSDGRKVQALGYVVDRKHKQYAGALDIAKAAAVVRGAKGQSGPNDEYVKNTVAHLQSMGIRDHWLEGVVKYLSPKF